MDVGGKVTSLKMLIGIAWGWSRVFADRMAAPILVERVLSWTPSIFDSTLQRSTSTSADTPRDILTAISRSRQFYKRMSFHWHRQYLRVMDHESVDTRSAHDQRLLRDKLKDRTGNCHRICVGNQCQKSRARDLWQTVRVIIHLWILVNICLNPKWGAITKFSWVKFHADLYLFHILGIFKAE